jgi:hypothetical protein
MELQVLYQWTEKIATHIPSLNSWQGRNSHGVVELQNSLPVLVIQELIGECERIGKKIHHTNFVNVTAL